ncbi:inosine/xanthosine triphosphatase [Shewanella sp. JM162201]|uniref:Inosine/xanthosine triphosphatase n=1 Tax=Shewanella jiangmenensis TaxID=2837387 RepID=A0ABS5UZG6_9GAMM|nr:inosine/xanthosine triphosphatase [Shewanella jiangmenensis]MBT1443589.1 inosine/xanthosine triphosphatase [Shewanella jiangmenensis]
MTQEYIPVLVGSTNPVKIAAARHAISALFPHAAVDCKGVAVPSGVPDQPMTAADTRLGAINRAKACEAMGGALFYVAMEGGVDRFEDGPATFAYVVIIRQGGGMSVGRSSQLPLPEQVFAALEAGEELGHVMDRLFHTTNIKQAGGAIALLTRNAESRESSYRQALILAMAPLLHTELYQA